MSIDNTSRDFTPAPTSAELGRMLDNGQWDEVKELIGIKPEEAEQLLSEGDWVDIDEVNKLLGITDEELA
jgi:hypothetical protein